MPFDSEGMFSRLHCWEDDRINDIDIVTDHMDEEDDNFADGLSQCFLKNGTSKMEGDFNAGNFKLKNIADGALPADAVNRSQLDSFLQTSKDISNALFLVGDIKASLISENHNSWILCNGQELNRSDYADLFALIGENFGAGDGVYTFNVPDYRGRFLRGLGTDSAKDIYTPQEESLPNISDSITGIGMSNSSSSSNKLLSKSNYGEQRFSTSGSSSGRGWGTLSINLGDANSIYQGEHVTPQNYAVNWFIKAKKEE